MLSDLRSLRERIRQVEAGGHRDTPLRRAYNRKLRALKISGGGVFHNNNKDISSMKTDINFLRSQVSFHSTLINQITEQMVNFDKRIGEIIKKG